MARVARVRDLDVLAAISLGGVCGALGRWGIEAAKPWNGPPDFPWATFAINVSGCLLIGLLMWFVLEVWGPSRYARPFLGIGVLGGFTTFSTYSLELRDMLATDAVVLAALYAVGTVLAGLLAVRVGAAIGQLVTRLGGR